MAATHLKNFDINPNDIIHFEDGIPGFEEYKDYVLMQEDDDSFVMIMQSVDSEHASFVVMDPYAAVEEYEPILSQQDKEYFGDGSVLRFLVVTVMSSDVKNTIVNLKSPIVIDVETNKAKQVFLENDNYPIRYYLFADNH